MSTMNLAKKGKILCALGPFANTHRRDDFVSLNVEKVVSSHSTLFKNFRYPH